MGTDYIIYCVVLLTDPPLMEIYNILCIVFIDRSSSDGDRSYNILCVVY